MGGKLSIFLFKGSLNRFIFSIALFYTFIFNIPFFNIVQQGIEKQADSSIVFIATIPFFLIFALSFIFSCFSFKYLVKPFFIVLTLLSSVVCYAAYKYNILFDTGMIQNIFETNSSEAKTYLNIYSICSFVLLGILPSFYIYKADIQYKPFLKEILHKAAFMVVMVAMIGLIAIGYYQNYASFGRNNSILRKYIVPTYFVSSAVKYVNTKYLTKPLPYTQLGTDAIISTSSEKPELMVMVVGETSRSMNYHYFGYDRQTNPYTSQEKDIFAFKDFTSCGTATAVSLPCMFSKLDRQNYNERQANSQDNLLDVISHAGIGVNWMDNDSGCKGVCKRVKHITYNGNENTKLCDGEFCYDQILVNQLKTELTQLDKNKNTVIVLHIIGSHGPTYFRRYPKNKRPFLPDCQRSDIENCTHNELINTYDNTVAYTDYILSQVINLLKKEESNFNTSMVYLSDHGESLGENGMYLHGAPYMFAPKEQTHVPFLLWLSPGKTEANKLNSSCIKKQADAGGFSQDNLFDTVLGLLNISTTAYDAKNDMLASCRV